MKSIAFVFLFFVSLTPWAQHEVETLKIGEIAPLIGYQMLTSDDDTLSLESINNENGYLIIFSCNTCPYVIGGKDFPGWEKDYPQIAEWAKAAKITMVLVNSNEAKRTDGDGMKDMVYRSKNQVKGLIYALDANHLLADAFGAKTTPHVFLFNNKHELIYVGSIDNSWDPRAKVKLNYLKNALEAIQLGKPIEVQETSPKGCSIKRK